MKISRFLLGKYGPWINNERRNTVHSDCCEAPKKFVNNITPNIFLIHTFPFYVQHYVSKTREKSICKRYFLFTTAFTF